MKKKKLFFYLGFFALLTLGFYYGLTQVIPGFGKVKLPVLTYVRPFHFQNQDGKQVDERAVQGKVYVAEFFFTTCKSICPIMNKNLIPIYEEFKDETGFMILSHTCDPETDSAARLKVYADSLNVNTERWMFVTGRKDSLYNAARNSYLLDDPKNNLVSIDEQFLHTQFFALVDKAGQVRKIYDGLKKEELEQLKKDIHELLAEPVSQERFSNNLFGS
ncbi:MAG: SCO family protein [Chitinophagaceae bacterium]|nr:SCO family protein [Chitinophagaceae bacterium]